MRFLLRVNLFRICKALRSARHNKCCVLAVTSTSNGTDTTNTNCILPGREEPGEEWDEERAFGEGTACGPWSCDHANGRYSTCGKDE